jgi:hypothetical protein
VKDRGRLLKLAWLGGIWMASAVIAVGETPPPEVYDRLPVREVTVFKDGHAFLLHEGQMETDSQGNVTLGRLPRPVLGTFWPFTTGSVKLTGVVAGRRRVAIERTALNLGDLLRANVGKRVLISEPFGKESQTTWEAVIAGFPERSSEELEHTNPPDADPRLPQKSDLVLLRTDRGTKVMPIARILDVTFLDQMVEKSSGEEWRDALTLRLDGAPANGRADVGLVYLQLGLRWIPSYRVTLEEMGRARVELEATLINELVDLKGADVHLAIGVPSFTFADEVDPISLKSTVARLASLAGADSQFMSLSNTIMSQQISLPARTGAQREAGPTLELGPALEAPGRTEDLYLFTLTGVTLEKGQRMTVPLASATLDYVDIYTVNVPFAVPPEIVDNLNSEQRREVARLLSRPRAVHKARLTNRGPHPLTTAPALIIKDGRPLGQGLMTYTPVGGEVDLEITTAVGLQVRKEEQETGRTPTALHLNSTEFMRIDLAGKLILKNFMDRSARLIVTRYALGKFDSVGQNGVVTDGSPFDDELMLEAAGTASWWARFSWPWWWASVNGLGRARWDATLDPGAETELNYQWHYYWH